MEGTCSFLKTGLYLYRLRRNCAVTEHVKIRTQKSARSLAVSTSKVTLGGSCQKKKKKKDTITQATINSEISSCSFKYEFFV